MNRRNSVKITVLLGAMLVMSGLGFAIAQDGDADSAVSASRAPNEMLETTQEMIEQGQVIASSVSSMLDEARQARDIVLVTCLDDKLTQINASLGVLRRRSENLESNIEAGNTDGANHEYTVVTVLNAKLENLQTEAMQCLGQDMFETGATTVITEIDPGTPSGDPGNFPGPEFDPVPYIPPPGSGDS